MMIDAGHSRRYINDNIDRLRRMFRWGASEELIPAAVYESLRTVESLPKGRSEARETDPVEPVDDVTVESTLVHLPPVIRDMVQLQRLTGARPTEVCILRPNDVDRSDDVWRYVPESHKTEHHGRSRVIFIGPRAQDILRPYLLRESTAFCFQPKESERKRLDARHAARTTPLSYGNKPGSNRQRKPRRTAGDRYDRNSYRRAIHRACDKAFPPKQELEGDALKEWQSAHRWSPNQLRHTAATDIRKRYGAEAAQVILGHAKLNTTEIYAERDLSKAMEIARQVG